MRASATKISAGAVCLALLISGCGGGSKTQTHSATTAPTTPSVTSASVPTPTTTVTQQTKPRTDLTSVIEDQNVAQVNPTVAMAAFKALGAQEVRVFVDWAYFAPDGTSKTPPKVDLTNPDSYSKVWWQILDNQLIAAHAAGLKVILDVGAPAPDWAEGAHPRGTTGGWKPNPTYFGDFMQALGKRYSGTYTAAGQSSPLPRVNSWSVWNEPNAVYLIPNAVGPKQTLYAPRLYRQLVDAAWSALASTGHSSKTDSILIGETAPRGQTGKGEPGLGGGIYPLNFIRALYCVSSNYTPLTGSAATTLGCPASGSTASFKAQNPGLFDATGFADHPYSDTTSPSVVGPDSADEADFATLDKLENALDAVFKAYGSSRQIPIYNTEYGYKTNPPTSEGVSYQDAAAWDNETEYLSWLNPRIHSYSQYLLIDPPVSSGDDFDTGLESPTSASNPEAGKPKPQVFDAFRMPLWLPKTSAGHGQKLEVWGCVRPVDEQTLSRATVDIQFASGSSSSYSTVHTATIHPSTGGCYFTTQVAFPSSGTVRLSYDDAGSTIVSRTQAVTIH